jgi:hypothetical protein
VFAGPFLGLTVGQRIWIPGFGQALESFSLAEGDAAVFFGAVLAEAFAGSAWGAAF